MPPPSSPSDSDSLAKIAVALDTDDRDQFQHWCTFFGPRVGVLKVGLEAFVRWGPWAAETAVAHSSAVFLDLKLHDIPNTVGGAVRSARNLGVRYLTLHAGGGEAMLRAAVAAGGEAVRLLAVTVLTHLDGEALERLHLPGAVAERAESWAGLAREAGCAGAVCSPHELPRLRPALAAPFQLVTPGIRPRGAARDDQRRVATPGEALRQGADLLVIGRPLTRAADPGQALAALARELSPEGA